MFGRISLSKIVALRRYIFCDPLNREVCSLALHRGLGLRYLILAQYSHIIFRSERQEGGNQFCGFGICVGVGSSAHGWRSGAANIHDLAPQRNLTFPRSHRSVYASHHSWSHPNSAARGGPSGLAGSRMRDCIVASYYPGLSAPNHPSERYPHTLDMPWPNITPAIDKTPPA